MQFSNLKEFIYTYLKEKLLLLACSWVLRWSTYSGEYTVYRLTLTQQPNNAPALHTLTEG